MNTLKTTIDFIEDELNQAGIKYEVSPVHDTSVMITSLRDLRTVKAWTEGYVTVQDASASLAIRLADPQPGMVVYDLCSAPGGKAVHAAERMKNQGRVVALELYESKLRFIHENAERTGISIIEPVQGDAREYNPKEQADIVLVDAPCSGLGTVSKKPDIKWRRTLDDVRKMSARQLEILHHAAKLVKPGGVLVYSTCTIEPEENVDVVAAFLADHPEYSVEPAEQYITPDVCLDGFLQTFPHKHKTDGAFAARLKRSS